jgi:endonuclease/exonuclease/phosphatase family metal-dependent hydrolase
MVNPGDFSRVNIAGLTSVLCTKNPSPMMRGWTRHIFLNSIYKQYDHHEYVLQNATKTGKTMRAFILSLIILLSSLAGNGSVISNVSYPEEVQPLKLKILSYNVKNCVGLDDVTDYNRVADVLRRINADVVAIQELDSATTRSKRAVVLNELAERVNMHASYSASIDYRGGKYGVGILTRQKPVSVTRISLPGKEEKRSLLIVELKDFVICCTHLSLTREDRLTSAKLINEATRKFSKPVFLAGDLNTTPGSAEMKSLEDEWIVLNNQQECTYPADSPNVCIDFILARKAEGWHAELLDSRVEPENIASDHRPVWVSLILKKK